MNNTMLPKNSHYAQNIYDILTSDNEPVSVAIISESPEQRREVLNFVCFQVINENVLLDGEDNCPHIAYFGFSKDLDEIKDKLSNFYGVNSGLLDNLHNYSIDDPGIINPEVAVMSLLSSGNYEYLFLDVGMNLYENENGEFTSTSSVELEDLRRNSSAKIVITAGYEGQAESVALEDKSIFSVFLD